jgi:PPM family protein phosphatase
MGQPVTLDAPGPEHGSRTHTGRRRANNEDYVLLRPDLGLYVVADGVGGRNTGEVASRLASLSMANFFEATLEATWPDQYRSLMDLTYSPGARRLSAAIRKANEDVHAIASTREQHHKMNTTVVALHAPPGERELHVAHVGDSRCYRVRDHVMEVLTRDHTLRNEARDQYPDIAEERLDQLPKNMLARALGRKNDVELTLISVSIESGDLYLLCSDGVNGMLDDARILETLVGRPSSQDAADRLIDLANAAGGRDNITAIVLRF